ncbi:MAG: IS1 family transposase [Oscillospiraceae bacterium]|nr:IS1 family transposase [Oscillospiraceae bacterium]
MTRTALKKAISQLTNYQVDRIQSIVLDYLFLNRELENVRPEVCPHCGANGFTLIKKGFSRGKQRFQCKCCQKKFTYDTLQITSHSHQPLEAWIVALESTLRLDSLEETARVVGVCRSTAFYMRRKLLVFMEQALNGAEALDMLVEADETYVPESQKSRMVTHRESRSHGEGVSLRGISREQLCVCVATDRDYHVIARCVNRGRPTGESIEEASIPFLKTKNCWRREFAAKWRFVTPDPNTKTRESLLNRKILSCFTIATNYHLNYKIYSKKVPCRYSIAAGRID